MKNFLIIAVAALLITSCSKSEFKETKVAPQMAPQTAAAPALAPDAANKQLPPGHPPIGGGQQMGGAAGSPNAPAAPAPVVVGKIAKAAGGITVAECFEKNPKLKGAKVVIHGQVVKYSPGIMGKNWIHLRDGSGTEGKNDLVVTTSGQAKLNDIITVTGKLQYDRDIGSGYFFPAIIEDASIKAE